MQSIQRYFADLSQRLGLADELIRLSPRRKSAKQPIQLGDVQDQTEVYLDLSSGAESGKGIFTGLWGMGALYMFLIMSPVFLQGRGGGAGDGGDHARHHPTRRPGHESTH